MGLKKLTSAYLLWAVVNVLTSAIFVFGGKMDALLMEQMAGTQMPDPGTAAAMGKAIFFVVLLIFLSIGFLFAVQADKGRVWAKWFLGLFGLWQAWGDFRAGVHMQADYPHIFGTFEQITTYILVALALYFSLKSFLSLRRPVSEISL